MIRLSCAWTVVVWLGISMVQEVCAGSGSVLTLPGPGIKNRSGLRMEIDTRWVSGCGYRPVRVRISTSPFGPAPADRTLEIHLRPRGWGGSKAGGVTATIELAQGATVAEAIISIPQTNVWNSISVETREDGWRHRDLSADNLGMAARYLPYSPDNFPSIVVVHWAADDHTKTLMGGAVPTATGAKEKKQGYIFVEPSAALVTGVAAVVPILTPRDSPTLLSDPPNVSGMASNYSQFFELNSLPDIRVLAGRFPNSFHEKIPKLHVLLIR